MDINEHSASRYQFAHKADYIPSFLDRIEKREMFTQWGLDGCLKIHKFAISGSIANNDYEALMHDFFSFQPALDLLEIKGFMTPSSTINMTPISANVKSMAFFDILEEHGIISPSGSIRGCFEDTFHGVTVSDKLREFLVNENSENNCIFSINDQHEFIFKIFKIICIGGAMCQPEHNIERYLEMAKSMYKEFVKIYKASGTKEIKTASKVFDINNVSGLELFATSSNLESPNNGLIVVVNSMQKYLVVLKITYDSVW